MKSDKRLFYKIAAVVALLVLVLLILSMLYLRNLNVQIEVEDGGISSEYTVQVVGGVVSDSLFGRSDHGVFSVMRSIVGVDSSVGYMGAVWLYAFDKWPDLIKTDIISSQHTNVELEPDAGNDDCPLRHLNIDFNCGADGSLINQSLTASFLLDYDSNSSDALFSVLDEYLGVLFAEEEDISQAVDNLIMLETTSFEMCDVQVTLNLAAVDKMNVYVQWSEF